MTCKNGANVVVFNDGHTEFIETYEKSPKGGLIDFKTVSGEYRYMESEIGTGKHWFFFKDERGIYCLTHEIAYLEWGAEEEEDRIDSLMEESLSGAHIKDSGDRTEFASGAVRDMREGKGRCDLMPLDVVSTLYERFSANDSINERIFRSIHIFQDTGDVGLLYTILDDVCDHLFLNRETMLLEVAKHFEEGAKKYGEYNWQKGIPVNCYIDSAVRHYLKWVRGDKDEPHDRAFVWNILCCIWTAVNKPELNPYGDHAASEVEIFADDRLVKVETVEEN